MGFEEKLYTTQVLDGREPRFQEERFVTRSARNGTPFENRFHLELFWTIFPSNPVEPARIAIFRSQELTDFRAWSEGG